MTYEDLKYTDRASLQYFNLLTTLVLYNQIPISALVYDNDSKRKTIIVLKVSPNGGLNTKQMTTRKDKMQLLEENLARDFPDLPIKHVSAEDAAKKYAELKG